MSDDAVDSPPGNNGKAPDGKFTPGNGIGHRFAPGNKHGRGNPTAIRMHEHRMQFLDAIAEGTIPALAKRLQVAALTGDEFAVKVLLDYCLGRPKQAVELTGADGSPLGHVPDLDLSPLDDEDLVHLQRIAGKLAGAAGLPAPD